MGTKAPSNPKRKRQNDNIVIVKPKEDQLSDATFHDLNANISPKELKVEVSNVRKIRKGGVLIQTSTSEDLDKLLAEFKAKDSLFGEYNIIKSRK